MVSGPWVGDVCQAKVKLERFTIDVVERHASHAQALQFTPEVQTFGPDGIIERLFPKSVTDDQQFAPGRIPDCIGKHATKFGYALLAFLLVQVQQNLRVAPGSKAVSLRCQVTPELLVVVDFAIEY